MCFRGGQRGTSCWIVASALLIMASHLETLDIPHLPESRSVYVALYRDVQNAAILRQQLLSGNKEFEYAFIDASMVR